MTTHSSNEQVKYTNDWFGTWSEFQKEDFVTILAQKLRPSQFINGLLGGIQNLNCSSRPPSLFSCQIKLFSEWWDSWTEEDRANFQTKLREKDSKFWAEVEGELDGTRKKLDEDFFLVSNNVVTVSSTVPPTNTNTTTIIIENNNANAAGDVGIKDSNVTNGNGEIHSEDLESEQPAAESVVIPVTQEVPASGEGDGDGDEIL